MTFRSPLALAILALAFVVLTFATAVTPAAAEEVTWRLEQPSPPPPPTGVAGSSIPIGLGAIGDVEFWAPNRGLLITAGNPPTIPAGVWTYNGREWHELSEVCGATDGRIAWAGPDEFWTISDGRPGQASEANGTTPPLEDDTLCHFLDGQVVTSYASPAFQSTSYQPMQAAGCISPSDCWFAGDPLPEPQVGAFQLHWNGSSLSEEPDPQGHAIEDMRLFGGRLYESVRLSHEDKLTDPESPEHPSVLRRINPTGVQPTFVPLSPGVPEYAPGEHPEALDFLRLGADGEALWGAAGPASPTPEGSAPGEVTVVRYAAGVWSQVLGPAEPPRTNPFAGDVVDSIAAEPGSESAWVALDSKSDASDPSPVAHAIVASISADGTVTDEQTLPSAAEEAEGIGPKGAAAKISCPAADDCWMATTQGWLFHLAPEGERQVSVNTDPAFAGLITYRPKDQGLPQELADAPPPDGSGLIEESPDYGGTFAEVKGSAVESKIQVPLLSDEHSRLVHGSTLELRFHLAVRARVRLLADRHKKLVASTPMRTLAAGSRKLLLRLNPHDWPTKLSLQTHPLAQLPTTTVKEAVGGPEHGGAGSNTISTGLTVLPGVPSFAGSGFRP
jgi:hypothetical protein